MAAAFVVHEVEEEEQVRRIWRRPRVFRDRLHPLDAYDDVELYQRYRCPRPVLLEIVDLLHDDVAHPTRRNHAVPACLQILSAIRYYATGSFQLVTADTVGLSQPTISRIITRVSTALEKRARDIIFVIAKAFAAFLFVFNFRSSHFFFIWSSVLWQFDVAFRRRRISFQHSFFFSLVLLSLNFELSVL